MAASGSMSSTPSKPQNEGGNCGQISNTFRFGPSGGNVEGEVSADPSMGDGGATEKCITLFCTIKSAIPIPSPFDIVSRFCPADRPLGTHSGCHIVAVSPTERRVGARISVGRIGQIDIWSLSRRRVVQKLRCVRVLDAIPGNRVRRLSVSRFRTAHFSADDEASVVKCLARRPLLRVSSIRLYCALSICARAGRHLLRLPPVTYGSPEHFHPLLRHEGLCPIPPAELPADQFGTLALPAHNRQESRRSGGRRRPAPGFADRWAGSRTETI